MYGHVEKNHTVAPIFKFTSVDVFSEARVSATACAMVAAPWKLLSHASPLGATSDPESDPNIPWGGGYTSSIRVGKQRYAADDGLDLVTSGSHNVTVTCECDMVSDKLASTPPPYLLKYMLSGPRQVP